MLFFKHSQVLSMLPCEWSLGNIVLNITKINENWNDIMMKLLDYKSI